MSPVWLREREGLDREGRVIRMGRFDGEHHGAGDEFVEGLCFDDALAWARARSSRVYLDAEEELFSVGSRVDPTLPPLTDEIATRLRSGRRRPLVDQWLDRTEADAPMRWEIVVGLMPDELAREARPKQEAVGERVVERLRQASFEGVSWSAEGLDAAVDDIDRQWQAVGEPDLLGWSTMHSCAFEVVAFKEAATHLPVAASVRELAIEEIRAATGIEPHERGAYELEGRWGIDVDVHPPGYVPLPRPVWVAVDGGARLLEVLATSSSGAPGTKAKLVQQPPHNTAPRISPVSPYPSTSSRERSHAAPKPSVTPYGLREQRSS